MGTVFLAIVQRDLWYCFLQTAAYKCHPVDQSSAMKETTKNSPYLHRCCFLRVFIFQLILQLFYLQQAQFNRAVLIMMLRPVGTLKANFCCYYNYECKNQLIITCSDRLYLFLHVKSVLLKFVLF